MAGKISELTLITGGNLSTLDLVEVVDVSDTTMAATGTNKRTTLASLAGGLGGEVFKQAQGINAQTGTSYTPVAGDAGLLVTLNNAGATTLTLPLDSVAIAIGSIVDFLQIGVGQVTVVGAGGVTVRVSGLTSKARARYSRFGCQKIAANTWSVYGDLAAA
jgi:hypothetical protein